MTISDVALLAKRAILKQIVYIIISQTMMSTNFICIQFSWI